ncbi:MAG: dihydrodipicolinate synthase family protein [Candidatus Omnitrophica bacterium]|nr:dihydrodipicolinate synthase family protein [Candidatus Omnitrophota bacterium]MCM8807120.1 dihydrodipicolinate synthase family protein [Candidatus Omnitrophota bacterium]
MENKFFGVYAALLTPFDENGEICKKRLKNLVKFLISKGIDGLYVCGSTGEGISMDIEERKMVAEIVKEEAENKINIIVHVGFLNTKNAVKLAKHAEKIKIDAISSIPPIYYKFSFDEIYDYYKRIAESTSLPFFIYYIPSTTGIELKNEDLLKFTEIKNIIGLKYTYPDIYLLQDLLLKTNGKWIAFAGSDELFLPSLTMGAVGCIGSTQNILPEIFVDIYKNFKTGNIKKAMELQKRITIAVSLISKYYNGITACKTALKFRGIDVGYGRSPTKEKLSKKEEKEFYDKWKKFFPEYCLILNE